MKIKILGAAGGEVTGSACYVQTKHARAIIDGIHAGALASVKTLRDATFGFDVITECPNVPANILVPRSAWADQASYDATARKLAGLFKENFKAFEAGVSAEIKAAGPV